MFKIDNKVNKLRNFSLEVIITFKYLILLKNSTFDGINIWMGLIFTLFTMYSKVNYDVLRVLFNLLRVCVQHKLFIGQKPTNGYYQSEK